MLKKYVCENFGQCDSANNDEIFEIEEHLATKCPTCKNSTLSEYHPPKKFCTKFKKFCIGSGIFGTVVAGIFLFSGEDPIPLDPVDEISIVNIEENNSKSSTQSASGSTDGNQPVEVHKEVKVEEPKTKAVIVTPKPEPKEVHCNSNQIKVGNECKDKPKAVEVHKEVKVKELKPKEVHCNSNQIKVGNECKDKPKHEHQYIPEPVISHPKSESGCGSEISEIRRLISAGESMKANSVRMRAMASDKCTDEQEETIDNLKP